MAFCYGISFVVVPAALNGLLKDLLPDELLVEANGSLSVTREAFRLVGPLLGATMFALLGGASVALVDAASFLVAAAAVAGLRVRETAGDDFERQHWLAEVGAGASFIRRTPVLLHTTLALGLACWCSASRSPRSTRCWTPSTSRSRSSARC